MSSDTVFFGNPLLSKIVGQRTFHTIDKARSVDEFSTGYLYAVCGAFYPRDNWTKPLGSDKYCKECAKHERTNTA